MSTSISPVTESRQQIQDVRAEALDLIRKMRQVVDNSASATGSEVVQQGQQFSNLLLTAVQDVNKMQQQAEHLKTAYELGDKQISLSQVVLASEQASLSFRFLLQLRNRAIDAYKEVMNMPI